MENQCESRKPKSTMPSSFGERCDLESGHEGPHSFEKRQWTREEEEGWAARHPNAISGIRGDDV